jgi:hypothetical protein
VTQPPQPQVASLFILPATPDNASRSSRRSLSGSQAGGAARACRGDCVLHLLFQHRDRWAACCGLCHWQRSALGQGMVSVANL